MDDAKMDKIKEKISEMEKWLNDADESRHSVYKELEQNLDGGWVGDEEILALGRELNAAANALHDLKDMLDTN